VADLTGKVVWVTGGSRGIGFATAQACGVSGARVAVCSRSASEIATAVAELRRGGVHALGGHCDVSSAEQVGSFAKRVNDELGPVDVLVNNAGVLATQRLEETREIDWDTVLDVNLKGAYLCVKACLPAMLKRRSGRIINVASISGTLGTPRLTAYCASKWGLIGLTKALAEETRRAGVQVMAVAPGSVDTQMLRVGRPDLKPDMTADDVASTIRWLAAEAPAAMTGAVVEVFG